MARLYTALVAVSAFCLASADAFADDEVGIFRVASDTNGEATVEMPFTPFGDGTISTFLAGVFFGDGSADSDRLWRISSGDGSGGGGSDGTQNPNKHLKKKGGRLGRIDQNGKWKPIGGQPQTPKSIVPILPTDDDNDDDNNKGKGKDW